MIATTIATQTRLEFMPTASWPKTPSRWDDRMTSVMPRNMSGPIIKEPLMIWLTLSTPSMVAGVSGSFNGTKLLNDRVGPGSHDTLQAVNPHPNAGRVMGDGWGLGPSDLRSRDQRLIQVRDTRRLNGVGLVVDLASQQPADVPDS